MQPIAVAIIHGIEIDDPEYWKPVRRLLREEFEKALGRHAPDVDEALIIKPVFWAPYMEERQKALFKKIYPESDPEDVDDLLVGIIRKITAGAMLPLVKLGALLVQPVLPKFRTLHYPVGRWIMVHFVGDIIGYERSLGTKNYERAHAELASKLTELAAEAGPDAPLCVIAHSFGTVLISDYIYDHQNQKGTGGTDLVAEQVEEARGQSALARGETLNWLFFMGSPLALWSLRYDNALLNKPIHVPGTKVQQLYPNLTSMWINYIARADIFAYPLRTMSPEYARWVTADKMVTLKEPVNATPFNHTYYWVDRRLMRDVARKLADGWREINPPDVRPPYVPGTPDDPQTEEDTVAGIS